MNYELTAELRMRVCDSFGVIGLRITNALLQICTLWVLSDIF